MEVFACLKDRQGNVTRAGGHIHEQTIQFPPFDVLPELGDCPCDDGAPPHDRILLTRQAEVHGDNLYIASHDGGVDVLAVGQDLLVEPEYLGNESLGGLSAIRKAGPKRCRKNTFSSR